MERVDTVGFAKLREKRNDDLCREMVELEVAVLSR